MPTKITDLEPWVRECLKSVDDRLMAQLREDARKPAPTSIAGGSMLPKSNEPPSVVQPVGSGGDGSGWQKSPELNPPSGIGLVDRLCDAQDALDRSERLARLREAAVRLVAAEEAAKKKEP